MFLDTKNQIGQQHCSQSLYRIKDFEFVSLLDPAIWSVLYSALRECIYVAFRPIGLTLTIPLRNSTNVPLQSRNVYSKPHNTNITNSPFDRKIEVCNVMKNIVHEWFITFFS